MSFGIPVRNGLGIGLLPSTAVSTLRIGGRLALILDFISTTSLDSRITFTRGTTATFVGSNGLIQSAAINAPRFDYDPVTLAPKGLLIEEARTNSVLYSEDFTNAAWTKSGFLAFGSGSTANATASPDGTINADLLTPTAVSGTHRVYNIANTVTATSVSFSAYVKSNGYAKVAFRESASSGAGAAFDLSNATVIGAFNAGGSTVSNMAITNAGNGWFRVSCTITFGSSTTQGFGLHILSPSYTSGDFMAAWTPNGTSGTFVWGTQLEAGSFATSYIPTVASTVTRNADSALMTGANFTSWYSASAGTFASQFTTSTISGTRTILDANDNTVNESIRLATVAADPFFTVTDGGVDQANIDAGTIAANATYKIAGAYTLNDFAASIGGGAAVVDTSGTLPTVNQLQIGNSPASNSLNGHLRSITYYNTRLPNATLQSLTL